MARQEVDDDAADQAWAKRQAMTLEQAIEYALSQNLAQPQSRNSIGPCRRHARRDARRPA
ncbi:MAG: hypothetical protein CL878_02845 [Dehalococcoidia bacterium]|nr:hypothetical protein [Dehalococcoidia bacterium]